MAESGYLFCEIVIQWNCYVQWAVNQVSSDKNQWKQPVKHFGQVKLF